jgi:hypothetical protein
MAQQRLSVLIELIAGRMAPSYDLLCGALRPHLRNVGTVREKGSQGFIKVCPQLHPERLLGNPTAVGHRSRPMHMSCLGYGFRQDGDYSNTKFDLPRH